MMTSWSMRKRRRKIFLLLLYRVTGTRVLLLGLCSPDPVAARCRSCRHLATSYPHRTAPPSAVLCQSCRCAVQILSPFSDKLPTSRGSSSSSAVQIVSSRIPDPVAVQRGSYRRAVRILSPCGDKLPTLHRSSMGSAVQLLSPRSADPVAT